MHLCSQFLPPLNPVRVLSLTLLTPSSNLYIYIYTHKKFYIVYVLHLRLCTYIRQKGTKMSCAYFSVVA